MSPLSNWFRGDGRTAGDAAEGSDAHTDRERAAEREQLEDALAWTSLIMNDDMDGAWKGLQTGDSSFHSLGAAVTLFMRAVLGFEKHVMAETTAKLADCEARAAADGRRAQRRAGGGPRLYPPGSEYELVRAETQLMAAVVGVLHESLVEAMRSFYKLRKAFVILDGIVAHEAKRRGRAASSEADLANASGEGGSSSSDDAADEHPALSTTATTPEPEPRAPSEDEDAVDGSRPPSPLRLQSADVDDPLGLDDPLDVFVHSGANLCLGIILLILSLVPPAFSRILAVAGFGGDRARGVRMLWRSAAHDNVNGALAGMVLLGYYNGLLGTVDIVPDEDDYDDAAAAVGPPRIRCARLLADLRARYPDSQLWRVEEARLLANEGSLGRAIEVLTTGTPSRMKQVVALSSFELGIDAMIMQDWALMRDTFLGCLDVNEWSPAMYYYMAGCAALELYRDAALGGRGGNGSDETTRLKARAEQLLRKAPQVAGKKRLMARQLPIETFVQRKVAKWEARARTLDVDLADAVGASPALEMCYMWNGHKRMGAAELARATANLGWERCTAAAEAAARIRAEADERAVRAVGVAAVLRRQGRLAEARALLEDEVLSHDRSVFKGPTRDDYVQPAATHELAAIAWAECCRPPAELGPEDAAAFRRRKADECQAHLDRARAWEAYTLDARIGMRVQSGLETLAWFRARMGWA